MKRQSLRPLEHLVLFGIGFHAAVSLGSVVPFSDPSNTNNWVLIEDVSDEFDGTQLDEAKWQICGRNGVFWNDTFTGRGVDPGTPGGWQFSPDNVRVEGGMLKIQTRHEPNYPWVNPGTKKYEFTTGGVWSKATFDTGYMEIRCKAADASTTGSFWTTGGPGVLSELDVFEAIGSPSANLSRTNKMWSSLHDWSIPNPNSVWTETTDLPFSFGDGFHTYAAEWDANRVVFYADGQLVHSVTKQWVETNGAYTKRWPLTGGQHIWADSEIFEWWGAPDPDNLPADYEIQYIRVWQKGPPLPASPWLDFVSTHGISGVKTHHSDTDGLNDWGEYVFDGDPNNPADLGILPDFNAATSEYSFQIRNDASLVAHVLTNTDLTDPDWATNATFNITANDGGMENRVSTLGTSNTTLFIRLRVDEVTGLCADDFEAGWGNWVSGGGDALLETDPARIIGTQGVNLQDNSGGASAITLASSLDLTGYSRLTIDFTFLPDGMEGSEDFWVRFSDDGGSSWNTVMAYVNNVDFTNGIREYPTLTLDSGSYNFTSDVKIRFQCDASANGDHIYIDDIVISVHQ